MLECSIKFLTYERAWVRAEKLRATMFVSKRPLEQIDKVASLSNSFKKKRTEFKNKLIENKEISKNY